MLCENTIACREGSSALESTSAVAGDQLAQLLEVWRLREGQEDAALKLEKGVRRDPYIFKRRGNVTA